MVWVVVLLVDVVVVVVHLVFVAVLEMGLG